MIEPTPRLHTPTWGRLDLPDGFAACLSCNEIMTVDQLLEPCKRAAEVDEGGESG